jgi:hypothetical protein
VNAKGTAVFLDTSIQIARFIHSTKTKQRIEERIRQYDMVVTSSVVKQEFKRRLLKEAKYVLDQLNRRESFEEVYYHVERLPERFPQNKRKRHVCLQMFGQLYSDAKESDLTDRLRLKMRYLLILGLEEFDSRVDQVIKASACACGTIPIREKKPFSKYEFGTDKCSETEGKCGVVEYLSKYINESTSIHRLLKGLPEEEKTAEIRNSEMFLGDILIDPTVAISKEPCLKVGDLIIALESIGIPTFYTLNGKESQFFCPVLGQELIVRPVDPLRDDVVYRHDDANRPEF